MRVQFNMVQSGSMMKRRSDLHRRFFTFAVAAIVNIVPLFLFAQEDEDTVSATDTIAVDTAASKKKTLYVYDSSRFSPRAIAAADMESYRADDEFDYARRVAPPTSFFERLFNWFGRIFESIFGNKTASDVFQYGIFGAALILVIILLARSEFGGFFKRAALRKGGIEYEEMEEDIHRMDFDALIAEAIAAGNLRRAVRLHYLKLLREMTERGLIEWRREKTNSDYLSELDRHDLRPGFAELTRIFDYVWYGGFEIDRSRYSRISDEFNAFVRTVQGAS